MRISDWSSDVCSSDLQSDELRDARDVGAEEVRIAEHVVHQRAAMDDMVDPPGKAVEVLRVQPEAGLGDVPHDDLEMVFRQVGKLRPEKHTSDLQAPMRISYAVICWTKKYTQLHQ